MHCGKTTPPRETVQLYVFLTFIETEEICLCYPKKLHILSSKLSYRHKTRIAKLVLQPPGGGTLRVEVRDFAVTSQMSLERAYPKKTQREKKSHVLSCDC